MSPENLYTTLSFRGFYSLILRLHSPARVRFRPPGTLEFPAGLYVYVGSALQGVGARLKTLLNFTRPTHWHIDRVLRDHRCRLLRVLATPSNLNLECAVSRRLAQLNFCSAVKGFGASDCQAACDAHFYFCGEIGVSCLTRRLKQIHEVFGGTVLARLG